MTTKPTGNPVFDAYDKACEENIEWHRAMYGKSRIDAEAEEAKNRAAAARALGLSVFGPDRNTYRIEITAEELKANTDENGMFRVPKHLIPDWKPEANAVWPYQPSSEQQARDMLERLGMPGAQNLTAGDVAELAQLIANQLTQKK